MKGLPSAMNARAVTWACAILAAALSLLYIAFYLRGGPRIIDATSYYLEGRALAEGHLAWPVAEPVASVDGRFLVRDTLGDGERIGVIFPPGYPALLALGFWLGAPLLVGPLLAAAIVLATARVTRRIAARLDFPARDVESAVKLASVLAATCACLRYHTADTMAHGLAAALVLGAVLASLAIADGAGDSRRRFAAIPLLGGVALGWLVATRPVSGVVGFVVVVAVFATARARRLRVMDVGLAVVGALPAIVLLLFHQHAVTGAWLRSSQALYYAVSDGPPGCFRYGFGGGIGCRIEHGQFVHDNLESGYGAAAALKTTLRRLKMHAGDALNAWPLAAVTLVGLANAARKRASSLLPIGVAASVCLYAPFYFDGNYPGGGARFYADTLPLELISVALWVPRAVAWTVRTLPSIEGWSRFSHWSIGCVSLTGFALFGARDHAALRDREGGKPMLSPEALRGVRPPSVVFVDTDHGFNLGFDPDATGANGVSVLRYRGDLTDYLASAERGMPRAFRYEFAGDGSRVPALVPYEPRPDVPLAGASLWPPLAQEGGFARVSFDACAESGKWLSLAGDREVRVSVELPRGLAGAAIAPRVGGAGDLVLRIAGEVVAAWTVPGGDTCARGLDAKRIPVRPGRIELELIRHADGGTFALDELRVSSSPSRNEGG